MHPLATTRRDFLVKSGLAAAAFSAPHIAIANPTADKKLRIGIVGCGGRANTVGEMAVKDGRYEITALADYFQDMVDEKGEKYGVPANRRFTGLECYRKMIEAGGIDVIAILSPPYFHPEQVEAAVEAGLHVWLAKPIAVDARGVARIEAAAARAAAKERVFFVDFQTRALAHYNEAARLVAAGALGKLGYGEVEGSCIAFKEKVPHEGPESMLRNWLQWRPLSGEAIIEYSVHAIDMASLMIGRDPLSATGFCGRNFLGDMAAPSDVKDHWAATYDYGDGFKVQFRCLRFEQFSLPGFAAITAKIYGTEGNLYADYSGEVAIRGKQPFNGDRFMNEKIRGIYQIGVTANWKTFHDLVSRGDFSQSTVAPSVRSHHLALLARDACEKGGAPVTWDEAVNNPAVLTFDASALKA
jgi:predicted dehydrogenase